MQKGVDKLNPLCYNNYRKETKEVDTMLELICAIPDHIGWVIVGAVGMLCVEMFGLLIGTVVQAIKERLEDDEEEA